ncbi:MAG: hypothetical protein IKF17_04635 [Clostridia bacterium]|nr:hypothetical protein [Clostridia bacterium]
MNKHISLKKLILIFGLIIIVFLVVLKIIGPFPCFSQKFVEKYVATYSKDFTFLKKDTYSVSLNGFLESNDTDWYFHDNELDFDFHVKTLKSDYPPKGKHIACNYYKPYIEKLINEKGNEIKQQITNIFDEILDIDEYSIFYNEDAAIIDINIDGLKKSNYSKTRYIELCQIAAKELCEYIEKYDLNFKNRNFKIGWDVDLNTDWSRTDDDLSIFINNEVFQIKDYYN